MSDGGAGAVAELTVGRQGGLRRGLSTVAAVAIARRPAATRSPARLAASGGQPGRPISAWAMGERLRKLGIRPAQARSTALFQLATELPAAVLARTLGIDITVAVKWQRAAAGDWAAYAAEVSQRPVRTDQHPASNT